MHKRISNGMKWIEIQFGFLFKSLRNIPYNIAFGFEPISMGLNGVSFSAIKTIFILSVAIKQQNVQHPIFS